MANEEPDFLPFIKALKSSLDGIGSGVVFFIVDNVSKDRTLQLCQELSATDNRFQTIWAPENRNVVDAYMRGYQEAYDNGFDYIIEMDAGLSHEPDTLSEFIKFLSQGVECVFGSRFIKGGSMGDSPFKRRMLSQTGTMLSNLLLGTRMKDMTSGFQGFRNDIVKKLLEYQLKSKAHFYQTEIRYLLRKRKYIEIPIRYKAPSPRVSGKAIRNSIETLLYYFWRRITFRSISL
ncbi:MAG: glycosyltransferase [Bacteroidetes bacterium]|nr:MAG: glycosyltransferase [Bacteroidota bacterium]REK05832.1 MAG: glycosyltransferase [Bacteroidota bacterium]REK32033.1 MAG: glycosyltransferase [Bacteroidota bacterium]REK50097.1 MAG: glycosyltransferase [Bacteroidota bacterium]